MGDGDTSLSSTSSSRKPSWEMRQKRSEVLPMSESTRSLLEEMARLSVETKTAVAIWALTEDSPKAVEMTTQLLREMKSATKHQALAAMTKALVKYPTPEMIRLRMKE